MGLWPRRDQNKRRSNRRKKKPGSQSIPWECRMPALCPAIEVYPVHHLPILPAYADQLGLVRLINHYVPTAREGEAGTGVLALGWATLSGRSPWSRLEECFAP